MYSLLKYLFFFLIMGLIWFLIFSIQLDKNTTIFLAIQNEVNSSSKDKGNANSNDKEIDRSKVIDALTKAFDSK